MRETIILIVENEAIVAADLEGKLRALGYGVAGIAAGGEEAVTLACRLRPHLVLMDIRLEGSIDGIEAAEAIRSRHDVPVIYLTAHSDGATLARAKLTGPFGYILKPFEERELATQIELALYKHQSDRQTREHREWLRVTLNSIGDAVIATDGVGRISFLNPVAESLIGCKAEEVVGRPVASVFRLVDEQTGQALEEPVARVLSEGRAVALTNHGAMVTGDGRTVPVEESAAPILDGAGQVIGAVLVFRDVTERRRAEEALSRSRDELELRVRERTGALAEANKALEHQTEVLQTIIDNIPVMLCFYNSSGEVQLANKEFERVLGWSIDDLKRDDFDVMAECYPDSEYRKAVWDYMEEAAPGWRDFTMRTRSGATLESSWANVRLSDGSQIGIGLDITDRKRSEDALKQSEEKYRGIFENAPIGIFQSTPEGGYINANPALARMLGYESPSDLMKSIKKIGAQLYVNPAKRGEIVESVVNSRDPHIFDTSYYRKDGSILNTNLTIWASRDSSGAIRYLEGFVEDMTARKEAEQEIKNTMKRLEQSNQALQDFASIASHDMQEPLRKVVSFGKMLKQKYGDAFGDEGKDFLDRMLNATERMQVLLNALLDYSKVSSKTEPFREVDLGAIVREVLSDLEVRIEKTGGEVHVSGLPMVEADPIQMRQLFQNLIGNALKFHKEGDRPIVEVRSASPGNGIIEIVVADNGIGFDEKYLDRIFAPFQRLHGRGHYEGTGMGLAICKKIVERHGGSMTAKSTPGHGSVFTVTLPAIRRERLRHV